MENEGMNICLSSDDNYAQHLGVTIKSLLNTQKDFLNIYILDSGISNANKNNIVSMINPDKAKIAFYPVNEDLFNNYKLDKHMYFTKAMFNRFKIPELFADKERVLYLDVDIVVLKNLHEFYYADMQDKVLGMVKDYCHDKCEERMVVKDYYNSGVILFDIKKCLEWSLFEKLMKGLAQNQKKLFCPDQDIINMVCQDVIKEFDFIYNSQCHPINSANTALINSQIGNIAILHYTTAAKPWNEEHPFGEYYLQVLENTPWQENLKEIKRKILYKKLIALIFSFEHKDYVKSWKIFGLPIFAKEKSDNKRIFYLLSIPVLSIRKKWGN